VSQWIGVHGIKQEYRGRRQVLNSWKPALADGLEWATERRLEPDLDVVYYGHLFREAYDEPGLKGSAGTAVAADLADATDEEIADLTSAVEEMVGPKGLTVASPPGKLPVWLPAWAVTLTSAIEQRFPAVMGVPVLVVLRQVGLYLRDPRLKAEVDQITTKGAAGANVLIGHSLGSVVAYEYLRQHPGHSVELLVTLGSPLGLKMVRRRLPAGEPGVAQWVNVRDPNDPVTAGNLSNRYPQVRDRRADNGSDAHSAEHYLSHKATGEALKEFLPGAGE